MKKIALLVSIFLFTLISFNQISYAQTPASKPYLSKARQTLAWPTDVLVENYSGQTVKVRFITIVSDDIVRLNSYPASNFYAQLLNQYNAYQVRVMIWDSSDRLFYDKVVGSVNRITLTPARLNEKLSAENITITK